ncbi:MAG: glucose-1-phosphate thymidylyltransferase, partial [Bacteroidia bacterium]
ATPSDSNTLIGDNIFIEEGATVEAATLNSKNGPIYIGKNAEIMEGATVRGPLALCEGSVIKMGAKIYGDTTIGPYSKVGGEVSNTVFYANSNKGHDGFLGNSVIGEWCNLGADTNCSNLKNNYAQVKLWNYSKKRFLHSGLQFCGLIMGDHSKCGINTMFNTGTVVGVSANIFGASFPRNFIPSFTWGGASGFATYTVPKALETARIVMLRRNKELNNTEKEILNTVFEDSIEHRFWENKPLNK